MYIYYHTQIFMFCFEQKIHDNLRFIIEIIIYILLNKRHLLVNEKGGLSITGVARVVSTAHFNWLIIEEESHLGFGVAVHEPKQVTVVILHAVLCVMLLAKEPTRKMCTCSKSIIHLYQFM